MAPGNTIPRDGDEPPVTSVFARPFLLAIRPDHCKSAGSAGPLMAITYLSINRKAKVDTLATLVFRSQESSV